MIAAFRRRPPHLRRGGLGFSRYPARPTTNALGRVSQEMKLPLPQFYLKVTLSHDAYEPKVVRLLIPEAGGEVALERVGISRSG